MEGGGVFVVAGCDSAKVFELADAALDHVAGLVGVAVEAHALLAFGFEPGDDRPNAPAAQQPAHRSAGVPLVRGDALGFASPTDLALVEQRLDLGPFVVLAGGQRPGDQLAGLVRTDVEFGAEPAPAAAEGVGPPFTLPAAC